MHKVRYALSVATSSYAIWLYSNALRDIFLLKSNTIIARSYGSHLQFLTILGVVASLFQQILSLLSLLTGLRTLRTLQNLLLIISAPLESVISAIYWPIKFYNPRLLIDPTVSVPIDPVLDRSVHMYPALLQSLSATLLSQKEWEGSIFFPLSLITVMAGAYWMWFEHTFSKNGFYPYPLLSLLSTQQKGYLVLVAALIALVSYKVLQVIQRSLRA